MPLSRRTRALLGISTPGPTPRPWRPGTPMTKTQAIHLVRTASAQVRAEHPDTDVVTTCRLYAARVATTPALEAAHHRLRQIPYDD